MPPGEFPCGVVVVVQPDESGPWCVDAYPGGERRERRYHDGDIFHAVALGLSVSLPGPVSRLTVEVIPEGEKPRAQAIAAAVAEAVAGAEHDAMRAWEMTGERDAQAKRAEVAEARARELEGSRVEAVKAAVLAERQAIAAALLAEREACAAKLNARADVLRGDENYHPPLSAVRELDAMARWISARGAK